MNRSEMIMAVMILCRSFSYLYSSSSNQSSSSIPSGAYSSDSPPSAFISSWSSIYLECSFCTIWWENKLDKKLFSSNQDFFKSKSLTEDAHSLWIETPPVLFFFVFGHVDKRTRKIPTTIILGIGWFLFIFRLKNYSTELPFEFI